MAVFASFPLCVELTKDNLIVTNSNKAGNKIFNLCINNENQSLRIKYVSDEHGHLSNYDSDWIEKVLALKSTI